MDEVLRVDSLNAGYSRFHVIFDVSFGVRPRDILVIVGPNGSGKSTTLKAIFGIATVFSGRIDYKGKDVTRLPPHVKARMGLAYLPQTDNVFSELSVAENLKMAAYTLSDDVARDRMEEILSLYPILKERLGQKAKTLSGGERQILALGMTLMRNPEIIMLDEPTGGLAPRIAREILQKIVDLRDSLKKTIILVEQNARSALEMGDNAILMVGGKLAFFGKAGDLLSDRELGKLYLGLR